LLVCDGGMYVVFVGARGALLEVFQWVLEWRDNISSALHGPRHGGVVWFSGCCICRELMVWSYDVFVKDGISNWWQYIFSKRKFV